LLISNWGPGELRDRLTWREPGRQGRDRRHGGIAGHPQRGAGAQGVPDQDDRNRTELTAEPIQNPAQILDRRSVLTVPAPELESRPDYHRCAAVQRSPDCARDRDHA
jgi:hypothetical protein